MGIPQFMLHLLLLLEILRVQFGHDAVDLTIALQVRLAAQTILALSFAQLAGRLVLAPPNLEVRLVLLLQRLQLGLVFLLDGRQPQAELRLAGGHSVIALLTVGVATPFSVQLCIVQSLLKTLLFGRTVGQQARLLLLERMLFAGDLTLETFACAQ